VFVPTGALLADPPIRQRLRHVRPVLDEWRTSPSGCGDTLSGPRFVTAVLGTSVVALLVLVSFVRDQEGWSTER